MSKYFFSVVIPSYNREVLLPETIDSILKQEFTDFEIIIVDDGSKDNTDKVILELYKDFNQIRYYKKINEERGRARNYGFEKATGEYVVFFDSDDLMLPHHLQICYEHINRLNKPNFIATKHLLIDQHGKKSYNQSKSFAQDWYSYKDLMIGNWLASHFAVKKNNPDLILYEEDRSYAILEDWIFLIMNLFKDKIYLIDDYSIHQRIHDGRSMNNNTIIIERREMANQYLIDRLDFSKAEETKLSAYSYYFCAIHAYLEKDKSSALAFAKKAYNNGGLSLGLIKLYLKLFLGYYPKLHP